MQLRLLKHWAGHRPGTVFTDPPEHVRGILLRPGLGLAEVVGNETAKPTAPTEPSQETQTEPRKRKR